MAKGGPDSSTVIGMLAGFGGLLVGFVIEGGSIPALFGLSALVIILAGTAGAVITSFNLPSFLSIGKLFAESMKASSGPTKEVVLEIISFAEKARREGLLALEDDVTMLENKFFQKGIRMVVDGVDPEIIRNTLENDIYLFEEKRKHEAAIFEQAGGFSPTMGIIGTVMGLVLVLSNLGGDASALGHAIAAAFIATLYGICFANLIWLPIANKLKLKMKRNILEMELILIGLLSLQSGDNPSLIKERLVSYLEEDEVADLMEQQQKE